MDLVALKSELTTDPLTRGYAALGDEAAADRINVIDRPGSGSVKAVLNYLMVNKNRINAGTDTVATSMLGRLVMVASATVGTDPFGGLINITLDMKCSALAFLEAMRNPNVDSLPYQNSTLQVLLTDLISSGVMKAADKTAIIALSNNLQSRGSELGFGRVTASNVADARRL